MKNPKEDCPRRSILWEAGKARHTLSRKSKEWKREVQRGKKQGASFGPDKKKGKKVGLGLATKDEKRTSLWGGSTLLGKTLMRTGFGGMEDTMSESRGDSIGNI